MELVKRIDSKIDNTKKFIFKLHDGLFTEFSYIDKEDGKIIICASTQTACNMGCQFCHLTTEKNIQRVRDLDYDEILEAIYIIADEGVVGLPRFRGDKTLLISYMGTGEPLENVDNVVYSMDQIFCGYNKYYKNVRFAVSTMVPENRLYDLFRLCNLTQSEDYQLKIHYSLHSTFSPHRKEMMPNALDADLVLPNLIYLKEHYPIDLELHYTLIKGCNDHCNEMRVLAEYGIPVKFLKLAEKEDFEGLAVSEEEYEKDIKPIFEEYGKFCEYYDPPGSDVGASCGQISLEAYKTNG